MTRLFLFNTLKVDDDCKGELHWLSTYINAFLLFFYVLVWSDFGYLVVSAYFKI